MQPHYVDRDEDLAVIGAAQRTSPQDAARDIPALWRRFMQEGVPARLPRRPDDPSVYCVYCDYESDHRGPYTVVLGVAVEPDALVPRDMRRVAVPRGRYARFVAEGDPAQTVWRTWSYVCEEWAHRSDRRYAADFERYDLARLPMGDGRTIPVEVVVGVS